MLQNERVWVTDTITGLKLELVAMTDFSFKRVMNGAGSGSATVMLGDERNEGLDLRSLLAAVRRTLVYEANGKPAYAGIITRTTYDRDAQSLTIEHKDIWWLLARRLAVDHGAPNFQKETLTYTNKTLGTIVKQLVMEAAWAGRPHYALPLVYPADVTGTATRKYYGYNYAYASEAIQDLIDTEGGPNVDFQPQWSTDGKSLQLALRAGSLTGKVWDYSLDAPDPGIYGLSVISDSESTTTNAVSIGEGTEKNMLVRSEPSLDTTFPAIEKTEPYKDISNVNELIGLAKERIRAQSGPTVQIAASIRKDGEPGDGWLVEGLPTVVDLRFGDTITLNNKSDPWAPAGKTSYLLIEFGGSLGSNMVDLQFQTLGA